MECYSCDISSVALECEDSSWISALDVIELYSMMTGSGEKPLVGRYRQTIDLRADGSANAPWRRVSS